MTKPLDPEAEGRAVSMTVELIVHGDNVDEIYNKAEIALEAFFKSKRDYQWEATVRAISLNDGTVMGYRADVQARAWW